MRLGVAVCDKLPLVPVMVTVKAPAEVELVVETVRVELPEPVTEVGLKVPAAPLGNPLTLRLTVPVKPFSAPMLIVYVVLLPAVTFASWD